MVQDRFIVIGTWDDPQSRSIRLQDFLSTNGSFIPIFSDAATFKAQVQGSGFEDKGIEIDRGLLGSILRGDEVLILDPGGPTPLKLTKADLMDGSAGLRE